MMRRASVRLLAATFERDADASAARMALAGLGGVVGLQLHPRQTAGASGEHGPYAVIVARAGLPLRDVVRQTVARYRGQVVIDLDDELGGGSKRSR